jgi:hypothetical protein
MMTWLLLAALVAGGEGDAGFQRVRIDAPYRSYLLALPALMESGGARVVRLEDGRRIVLGVGMAALADERARTLVNAHRVADLKAMLSIGKQESGVQVVSEEVIQDRTVLKLENGRESGRSVAEVLSMTTARFRGVVGRGLDRVGTWRSSDGRTLYLAMGMIVAADGKRVEQ